MGSALELLAIGNDWLDFLPSTKVDLDLKKEFSSTGSNQQPCNWLDPDELFH